MFLLPVILLFFVLDRMMNWGVDAVGKHLFSFPSAQRIYIVCT